MMSFLMSNWEWLMLAMYVIEKVVKLSPTKKDDVEYVVSSIFKDQS